MTLEGISNHERNFEREKVVLVERSEGIRSDHTSGRVSEDGLMQRCLTLLGMADMTTCICLWSK